MTRTPLLDTNRPKNRVEVLSSGEPGAKLIINKGGRGKKTTYVQLPENLIKPTDQNYKSQYSNDYCKKHKRKPPRPLGKSYTTGLAKFAENQVAKATLPDHYNIRPLGTPQNDTEAEALRKLQRIIRNIPPKEIKRMGLDGQVVARDQVTTPYEEVDTTNLITGRPTSQRTGSRDDKMRTSVKTLPTTNHEPPPSRSKQRKAQQDPPASEQLSKAADKLSSDIQREYDGCKRERGWIYAQAGAKEPIGHVSTKKKVFDELSKRGDLLPGFKEWLDTANEYEKYVVHDFAEHMARNLGEGEEEEPAEENETPRLREEDLTEEQWKDFQRFCEEREKERPATADRPMSPADRPMSAMSDERPMSALPSSRHEMCGVDGQVVPGKNVAIHSPTPPTSLRRSPTPPTGLRHTPTPPTIGGRRAQSADISPRPMSALPEEEPHARSKSADLEKIRILLDQPMRGGPRLRHPHTMNVPATEARREAFKHCCTTCDKCTNKQVDQLADQLEGVKPVSHEQLTKNRYLPDGVTLANVYPQLNNNIYSGSISQTVNKKSKVGCKGHFIIHPQFMSENGKKTRPPKSHVFDFTKYFK